MLNEDYKDMLRALSGEKVELLLAGAYALAAHGYPRATMDIDIRVMPSADNAAAVLRALRRFGAPLHDLTGEDLQLEGPFSKSVWHKRATGRTRDLADAEALESPASST